MAGKEHVVANRSFLGPPSEHSTGRLTHPKPYNPFVRVLCNKYEHGGARFYTIDEHGARRLLADTYNAEATARVAEALNAEINE